MRSFCTPAMWRGWVVRMKSSLEISRVRHRSAKAGSIESHQACGESKPFFSAASATFSPCSSMPVRNFTSAPHARRKRACTSARTVQYAVPRWGLALT